MPLSKEKNRERMREIRLHAKKHIEVVQPDVVELPLVSDEDRAGVVYIDADGNPVYE